VDWKILLVIILAVAIIIGFVSLGVLLQKAKKKLLKERAEKEKWKGRAEQRKEEVKRLLDQKENEGLSDEDAIKKANELMAGWSAVDSDDTS
jgi:uncharacterized protein HemX